MTGRPRPPRLVGAAARQPADHPRQGLSRHRLRTRITRPPATRRLRPTPALRQVLSTPRRAAAGGVPEPLARPAPRRVLWPPRGAGAVFRAAAPAGAARTPRGPPPMSEPLPPSPAQLRALFLTVIFPRVRRHARIYFRHVRCRDRRADHVAEAVALAWKWFVRLAERGKDATEFPATRGARRGRDCSAQPSPPPRCTTATTSQCGPQIRTARSCRPTLPPVLRSRSPARSTRCRRSWGSPRRGPRQ